LFFQFSFLFAQRGKFDKACALHSCKFFLNDFNQLLDAYQKAVDCILTVCDIFTSQLPLKVRHFSSADCNKLF
jgi:hypothetical protein